MGATEPCCWWATDTLFGVGYGLRRERFESIRPRLGRRIGRGHHPVELKFEFEFELDECRDWTEHERER